jgi:hypothetical protein
MEGDGTTDRQYILKRLYCFSGLHPFSTLVEKAFPSTSICDLVVDRTGDSSSYFYSLYSDASLITFLALLLVACTTFSNNLHSFKQYISPFTSTVTTSVVRDIVILGRPEITQYTPTERYNIISSETVDEGSISVLATTIVHKTFWE